MFMEAAPEDAWLVGDARLVDGRRQGALAHAARARPAGLTDQDLLGRKGLGDLAPDRFHVRAGCASETISVPMTVR